MIVGVSDRKDNKHGVIIRPIRISDVERKHKRKEILKVLIKEKNV
jgi:hypothetical protein